MQPELSVVVPCFNEEFNVDELSRRVLGVFEVGGFPGELVLVDDGSADGTRAAIEALAAKFPGQVVGQFHAKNAGIAAAWRTGTAAARGRLVAIIDGASSSSTAWTSSKAGAAP
jgi:phenylacetate-CoA ligase